MVAIVSGNSLGLDLTSLRTLGAQEFAGNAAHGRNGEGMYVNVATGNMVVQAQDARIIATGVDVEAVRTYNSQGLLDDHDGDNWSNGFYLQPLKVVEATASSPRRIERTGRDGAVSVFTGTGSAYTTTDGDGAHDTITLEGALYTWRDGASGAFHRYESSGNHRLVSSGDPSGKLLRYSYDVQGRISTVLDDGGNGTRYVYDAANHLVELRTVNSGGADVTRIRYEYRDGRLVEVNVDLSLDSDVADADLYWTRYGYDADGRVTVIAQKDGTRLSIGYISDAGVSRVERVTNALDETTTFSYATSALGIRTTTVTDPMGRSARYLTDAKGQLVRVLDEAAGTVTPRHAFAYDALGNLTSAIDGEGRTLTYEYDAAGNVLLESGSGGQRVARTYDNARQLLKQTNTRGQQLAYLYDAAGQVTEIRDSQTKVNPVNNAVYPVKVTTYAYDLSGRRLLEKTVAATAVYQDNHLGYDAQGRLREVSDARVRMLLDYDANGNRVRVYTALRYAGMSGEVASTTNRFFTYDEMNRQKVVDAVDALGTQGVDSHALAYDKNGNRLSDTYMAYAVIKDAAGNWSASEQKVRVTELYTYDVLNRLTGTRRDDNLVLDLRRYDAADRVMASGVTLGSAYRQQLDRLVEAGHVARPDMRVNRYDANGRLLHQTVKAASGVVLQDISWDPKAAPREVAVTQLAAAYAEGYDHAGNVKGYTVFTHTGSTTTKYSTTLERYEGYVGAENTVTSYPTASTGTNKQVYDANGHLVRVEDNQLDGHTRSFVNDAEGRALHTLRGEHEQRQFIVNGEVLGRYGVGVHENMPTEDNGTPNFTNVADFNFSFSRISATHPAPSPGAYVVQAEDTLETIARSAYGDAALWYRLADANGLSSNSDVRVGQVLNIPNRVGTIHNNDGTFKPYDPSKITGDVTPHLPIPKGDEGCGAVGQVLMVVVAAVATVFTAGAGAVLLSGGTLATATVGQLAIAGMGAMTGTFGAGLAAVAGAVGSIASQVVGVAVGATDKFSWKGVALSAVSAGATAGLGGAGIAASIAKNTGSLALGVAAQAMTGNLITQGIGLATGLQSRFAWRSVAAAGVGAAVGHAIGQGLAGNFPGDGMGPIQPPAFAELGSFGDVVRGTVAGVVSGTAAAVMRGGRVAIQQIAVDAFGNALGYSLADAATASPSAPIASTMSEEDWRHLGQELGLRGNAQDAGVLVADASGRIRLPAGWSMNNGRMVAPDGTEMGLMSGGGMVNINIRDGQAPAASGIPISRQLANIEAMAAAYHASGMTGATGDVADDYTPASAPVGGTLGGGGGGDRWIPNADGLGGTVVGRHMTPEEIVAFDAAQASPVSQIYNEMNERLSGMVNNAQDQYVQSGAQSSGWRYGLNAAGYVASEFFPRSVGAAAFAAVGGPIVGRVVGWGARAAVSAFPVLGREVGAIVESGLNRFAVPRGGVPSTNPSLATLQPPVRPARPSWRVSERDLEALNGQGGYSAQASFLKGLPVPRGTSGSTRPDLYRPGESIDIKNYNLATAQGQRNLVRDVVVQAQHRAQNLPAGDVQKLVIDARGQSVSTVTLNRLAAQIQQRSNSIIGTQDIQFWR